jgi:SGNH hydrolase-like domain, acetyltransferase AlgX
VNVTALGGYNADAETPHPELSWTALWDNTYQPTFEKYLEDRIGFREWLIRLRNQVGYSFLQIGRANNILVGKNQVLFEEKFIQTYHGQEYVGDETVHRRVRQVKAAQDALARQGILLVFALAPDKAAFYPEYHPNYYQKQPRTITNYEAHAQQMRKAGVNLMDLSQCFRQWKDTASYPLFPRGGIHWSDYGVTLAADTLFRYIEQKGGFDMPDFQAINQVVTDEPRHTDNDIAKAMNLIWEPQPFQMAYPTIQFQPLKPNQKKPRLLVVGDSFTWSLLSSYPYLQNLFDEPQSRFWYYNQQIDWPGADVAPERQVNKLDFKQELLSKEVVLVLFTEYLVSFDYGFTQNIYQLLCPLTPEDQKQIALVSAKLRKTKEVEERLWRKSYETNRSFEDLLQEEASLYYESHRPYPGS